MFGLNRCLIRAPRLRLKHVTPTYRVTGPARRFQSSYKLQDSDAQEQVLKEGWEDLQVGEYELALNSFEEVLKEDPEHINAMVLKAFCLEKLSSFEEALELYNKVLEKDSGYIEALFNKATIEMKLGKNEEALGSFMKCLELDPNHVGAHTNIGIIHQCQGNLEEAMKCYAKSLEISPSAGTYLNLGLLHEQREEYDQAISHFDKCLELDKENLSALHHKGNALYFLGKHNEAVTVFIQVIALDKTDPIVKESLKKTIDEIKASKEKK